MRVWDAESGQCLEVIGGSGDVRAIGAGPLLFPLRAVARGLETVVERARSGKPVACFAVPLDRIVTHPSRRTWAGASDNHLYIITLEGGPTCRASRARTSSGALGAGLPTPPKPPTEGLHNPAGNSRSAA